MKDFDLRKYLAENKLLKEDLADRAFELEMNFMDPSNKYGDEWQEKVSRVLLDKYEGKWENWVNDNPEELEMILDEFEDMLSDEAKKAEYTEFVDDGENQFIDLDYDKIRAYISAKKGPDFADDFMSDANEDFYENVVRFLDKIENPTDEEVLNFVDIEIEKR